MKILYGVVGEGMGHATRSRVSLEWLLAAGHEVHVVVSGRAHRFLGERLAGRAGFSLEEIHGLHLRYEGNRVDLSESLRRNLEQGPEAFFRNVAAYLRLQRQRFEPELVISDFESWAYLYGLAHRLPVVSIDNMQVLARCRHTIDTTALESFSYQLARTAVKLKLPGAYHYLITSFFYPPVKKPRTTLIPPILRPEILAARREPGEHVLVYQTAAANSELVPMLQRLPGAFKVYGLGRAGQEGNVTLCPFSETAFVDDLRTARAVVAGGGFSLMGEAVHLRVPLLAIPLEKQYEQELNARYLEKLGYGSFAESFNEADILGFLGKLDQYSAALQSYPSPDNGVLYGCLAELLARVAIGEPPPDWLDHPAPGKWEGPLRALPDEP